MVRLAATHDVDSDNLTVGLLDLLQLPQKVPEPRLGDDLVGGKDPHPVELGGGLGLGREGSTEDRVFGESGHFSAGTQSERIRGGQLGVVVVTGLEKGQVDERASSECQSGKTSSMCLPLSTSIPDVCEVCGVIIPGPINGSFSRLPDHSGSVLSAFPWLL